MGKEVVIEKLPQVNELKRVQVEGVILVIFTSCKQENTTSLALAFLSCITKSFNIRWRSSGVLWGLCSYTVLWAWLIENQLCRERVWSSLADWPTSKYSHEYKKISVNEKNNGTWFPPCSKKCKPACWDASCYLAWSLLELSSHWFSCNMFWN